MTTTARPDGGRAGGGGSVLLLGDCRTVMATLEAGSVDAIVTDPPAGIAFMGKDWDRNKGGRDRWIDWLRDRMDECRRVAKPGAHALVWSLPRTSHWTAMALEDAGWRIDDRIAHIFGSGFPKHKSKLKPAVEDWWLCTKPGGERWLNVDGCRVPSVEPVQSSAGAVGGYGGQRSGEYEKGVGRTYQNTAGRWPTNLVLTHHPDCWPCGTKRVKASNQPGKSNGTIERGVGFGKDSPAKERPAVYHTDPDAYGMETVEAWECVEGCPVAELDRQSGERTSGKAGPNGHIRNPGPGEGIYGNGKGLWINGGPAGQLYSDTGGASRFYPTFAWEADDFAPFLYCPKASRDDRGHKNTHPTVKPLALMRWLVRLITPEGGTVLDPFLGSGTTGLACVKEGFRFIGCESDAEYLAIARRRMDAAALPLLDMMEAAQ